MSSVKFKGLFYTVLLPGGDTVRSKGRQGLYSQGAWVQVLVLALTSNMTSGM